MPAERFREYGLVNRIAEPGAAVEVALALAEQLAKSGPLALIASKQILQEQFDWSTEEMWEKQGAISGPVFVSEDSKEGANAFKEKREPVWKGR
jgi:enoyl-CoA hydratase